MKVHGFRAIVFIGDSGPNQPVQNALAAPLNAEWARSNIRVHALPAHYCADPEGNAAEMVKRGIRKEEVGDHAGVRETSQLRAIVPNMIRTAKLQEGNGENCVQGDPRHSKDEIGRAD